MSQDQNLTLAAELQELKEKLLIEEALENIRERVMLMQTTAELPAIASGLYEQMNRFGIHPIGCAFSILNEKEKKGNVFITSDGSVIPESFIHPYEGEPVQERIFNSWLNGKTHIIINLKGDELKTHLAFIAKHMPVMDMIESSGQGLPDRLSMHIVYFKYGFIGYNLLDANEVSISLIARFAKVFEQTYTRFLDLQKAEKLAREVQIEAALERVRSRSMAMRRTEELQEAAEVLNFELSRLGLRNINQCGYAIYNNEKNNQVLWLTKPDGTSREEFTLPSTGDTILNDRYQAWLRQEPLFYHKSNKKEFSQHLQLVFDQLDSEITKEIASKEMPDNPHFYCANFGNGYLHIVADDVLDQEQEQIMVRFTRVFSQTYTRFLDLQKAEAQAREAQIEAALERVRSKSMAMQKSTELADIAQILFKEVEKLGVKTWAAGFNIFDEEKPLTKTWMSLLGQLTPPIQMPHDEDPTFKRIYNAWKHGEKGFVEGIGGDDLAKHYQYMNNIFSKGIDPAENMSSEPFTPPAYQVFNAAFFKHGHLMFITFEPDDENQQTFQRFAKVFEQTYTRFLDLQKAEKQAREAQIEAALERVRSRSMAMHHSKELNEVVSILYEQVQNLGFSDWGCSIIICDEHNNTLRYWYAGIDQEHSLEEYKVQLTSHPVVQKQWESWKKGIESFSIDLEGEAKNDYTEFLLTETDHKKLPEEVKEGWRKYPNTYFHYSVLKYGLLEFVDINPINDQNFPIYHRFAKVFEQTYTRFLDLQRAEAQAREAEIELSLERVRARTMAMHQSKELAEVVGTLYRELNKYKMGDWGCNIMIFDKEKDQIEIWLAEAGNQTFPNSFNFQTQAHEFIQKQWQLWKNQSDEDISLKGRQKISYDDFILEKTDFKNLPVEIKKQIRHLNEIHFSFASMKYGLLAVIDSKRVLDDDEKSILKRFANVFEQTYTRFLDLKKAEIQAREAQIEAALERVRSRSMAMRTSSELSDTASILFKELTKLGGKLFTAAFVILDDDEKGESKYNSTAPDGEIEPTLFIPNKGDTATEYLYAGWKAKEKYRSFILEGDEIVKHYEYMLNLPKSGQVFQAVLDSGNEFPSWQQMHAAYFKEGFLMAITTHPFDDPNLLIRFAKVFEQTYTRFLDLQKAETQAREAQIEVAMERIRARASAMHKSEELKDVAMELRTQMTLLGQKELEVCGIHLYEVDEDYFESWGVIRPEDSDQIFQGQSRFPKKGVTIIEEMLEHYYAGKKDYVLVNAGKKADEFFSMMKIHAPEVFKYFVTLLDKIPAQENIAYWSLADFNGGSILMVTYGPPDEDSRTLLRRVANVFDLAYRRFLDLKNAEKQAREAQIEAALERVRAQTMAMHNSEDVGKCVVKMFSELTALGVDEGTRFGIGILNHANENNQLWTARKNGDEVNMHIGNIDMASHPLLKSARKAWKEQLPLHKYVLEGEDLLNYYQMLNNAPDYKILVPIEKLPEREFHYGFVFDHGFFYAFCPREFQPELIQITQRFSSQFAQTYQRYLDLVKAEAQAREAKIELSLERIRAVVTAMQESSDLFDIVVSIRAEFLSLGHQADYFWHMRWLPESYEMSMTSEDGSRIGMVITIPKFVHEDIPGLMEWEKGNSPVYVLALDPVGAWSYIDNMNTYGAYEVADPNAPTEEDIHHIGGLTFILARTTHGEIGFSLPGVVPDPPKEALDTLIRFAGVFDLAYKRFEDLKASERQALMIREERDRLEIALNELRATQAQLIQQEKLASLGQLTAGIAHEIKNPLNFVNNFSEVSLELIEEALEEITNVRTKHAASPIDQNESLDEVSAILDDVQSNLTKIHEHGTRANNIVNSMLQHSRGGSGKMEATDLNALIKEYVNLSFHGMRAGKNPINVAINLDLDDAIAEVALSAEDFSRVILNLCNNAFDAMRSLSKPQYLPALSVRTKKSGDKIIIEVEDNGPGIPDEIKDKILQPFFTTKKGTEGTGLGLSITNDIIKAHGGHFTLESEAGKGAIFTILLPINND